MLDEPVFVPKRPSYSWKVVLVARYVKKILYLCTPFSPHGVGEVISLLGRMNPRIR